MITEALLHFPGIGPARLRRLRACGVRNWSDVLTHEAAIPRRWRLAAVEESQRCLAALVANEIGYFVEHFAPQDRWRILQHYLTQVSFFDIETAGLEQHDPITVIVCWHQGQLHTFVEYENLDDFLTLLPEIRLLTSYNGSSFDVPRVIDTFHIPELPCPHLDLRWLCFHQGLRGGLKEIAARRGIERPRDLQPADGAQAILLWEMWHRLGDRAARDTLIRYCAADVLLLTAMAQHLVGREPPPPHELWQHLPAAPALLSWDSPACTVPAQGESFGNASPARLRGRRPRAADAR